MPVFSDFAGLSPSCWAVLVQMEHWADKSVGSTKNSTNSISNIQHPLVIAIQLQHKNTPKIFWAKVSCKRQEDQCFLQKKELPVTR